MLKLTHRWAKALMEYAEDHGLEKIYRQVMGFLINETSIGKAPEELRNFLVLIPDGREEIVSVLHTFLDIAQNKMNLFEAEVVSAVPLTPVQLKALEDKLVRMLGKQLDITTTVDPSILGGLKVIVGNTVMDDSIKRKLMDMKKSIYEGVYIKQ